MYATNDWNAGALACNGGSSGVVFADIGEWLGRKSRGHAGEGARVPARIKKRRRSRKVLYSCRKSIAFPHIERQSRKIFDK